VLDFARFNHEGVMELEAVAKITVDCAYELYRDPGPGLLESVYEAALADRLRRRSLSVASQVPVPARVGNRKIEIAFRVDLLVEKTLLVELKSTEALLPVHSKQTLTYLRLMDLSLGLLINFGAPSFRQCVKRIVHNHHNTSGSDLRIHKPP
jgi:GxxExxY protein